PREGGREVGGVAPRDPGALAGVHVDPLVGYQPNEGRRLVYGAGVGDPGEQQQLLDLVERLYPCFAGGERQLCDLCERLSRCFVGEEAMLCEINPLVVTPAGELRALDAKVTIDDSAL